MKKLFYSVGILDSNARGSFGLSEELMMEHAALAIKSEIEARFALGSSVLVVVGCGNNGADGYALARLLYDYSVSVLAANEPKSELCKLQCERAKKCGVKIETTLQDSYDVVVDAIFGSGLSKALEQNTQNLINQLNAIQAYKIACDVPSGLFADGRGGIVFLADLTVTMGAPKLGLFSDFAKDCVGDVLTADLGVSSKQYEADFECDGFLLEKDDLTLPTRIKKSSHKGDYGHLAVFVGDKEGAGALCGLSALGFGCGLTTLITGKNLQISPELMQDKNPPSNTSAICIGSGLGNTLGASELTALSKNEAKFVIDADMFGKPEITSFLQGVCVLTPHPKEFVSLLNICEIGDFTVAQVQADRFGLAKRFSLKYPSCILVLKGANTVVAENGKLFVCALGSAALAKGGSGDVLAGLIGALLAQGYKPLEAAKSGVLAHALASQKFANNYALTPLALIEKIKEL